MIIYLTVINKYSIFINQINFPVKIKLIYEQLKYNSNEN